MSHLSMKMICLLIKMLKWEWILFLSQHNQAQCINALVEWKNGCVSGMGRLPHSSRHLWAQASQASNSNIYISHFISACVKCLTCQHCVKCLTCQHFVKYLTSQNSVKCLTCQLSGQTTNTERTSSCPAEVQHKIKHREPLTVGEKIVFLTTGLVPTCKS